MGKRSEEAKARAKEVLEAWKLRARIVEQANDESATLYQKQLAAIYQARSDFQQAQGKTLAILEDAYRQAEREAKDIAYQEEREAEEDKQIDREIQRHQRRAEEQESESGHRSRIEAFRKHEAWRQGEEAYRIEQARRGWTCICEDCLYRRARDFEETEEGKRIAARIVEDLGTRAIQEVQSAHVIKRLQAAAQELIEAIREAQVKVTFEDQGDSGKGSLEALLIAFKADLEKAEAHRSMEEARRESSETTVGAKAPDRE